MVNDRPESDLQVGSLDGSVAGLPLSSIDHIFDNLDASIYVMDIETDEILFVNDRINRSYRTARAGVGQRCWEVMQTSADGRCDFCPMHKLTKEPEQIVRWDVECADGRVFRNTDRLIEWTCGKKVHLQLAVDVTSYIKMERELLEAKETAEKASKIKSSFLASMSHELRTPLNAIKGLTELELRKTLPVDTLSNLEKVFSAGNTLLSIINDILDISKIEAGRMELLPVDYDVANLIGNVVSMNIVRIGSKPLEFRLKVDEKLPSRLYGDDLRILQIVNNLVSNAIKYTKEGFVELYVHGYYEADRFMLCFDVKDSGIGISPENIEKLFGAYEQVDMASHRATEGTGLGLAICKNLVRMMQGNITVESEYGRGSLFCVTLRQNVANVTIIGSEVASNLEKFDFITSAGKNREAMSFVSMTGKKVLVVDDVEMNIEVAQGMMEYYDLTVHRAASGWQAIQMIRDENPRYDLIFMDHMMPGIDGVEAVRIIRNEIDTEYARSVPIIALTATAMAGADDMFLKSGFQGYLSKPIDSKELDAILLRWISHPGGPESPEPETSLLDQRQEHRIQQKSMDKFFSFVSIDGMDFAQGLARFDYKPEIYLAALRGFTDSAPGALRCLKEYCESDDESSFADVVQDIKLSCYSIGADKVGRIADTISIPRDEQTARQLNAFCDEIEALVEKLASFI
ncbi:MAG: response regulator [Synergistaceae bacterium]|jgi:signal transduction histidine kinase/DNA-binding NarL/FixJ family response regulator|nr:response regulator [Synergistaceae bacterium]